MFTEVHQIVQALRNRDVEPALQWVELCFRENISSFLSLDGLFVIVRNSFIMAVFWSSNYVKDIIFHYYQLARSMKQSHMLKYLDNFPYVTAKVSQ